MQKGLVSVITPCYNTGDVIHRLLNSILVQDYPLLEMLIIDDGSTDNSKEIIDSYISAFKERGYVLEYRYQDNQGQSVAINNALKWVRGEFLIWPDSDDFYSRPDAISSFVSQFRELKPEYAVVRCFPTYVNEKNMEFRIESEDINLSYNQFYNCLYNWHFIWGAGNYMIRMEAFDKVNPFREIYVEKDAGQNWQMFLPLLYSFRCYTLRQSYFKVLERPDSHSRGLYKTYEQEILKISSYENTVLNTLDRINEISESEKNKLKAAIHIKYLHEKLKSSLKYGKKKEAKFFGKSLSVLGERMTRKEYLLEILMRMPWLYAVLRYVVLKIKRIFG